MMPAPLTYIQSLRENYFAAKEAYKTADDDKREALPDEMSAVCTALIAAVPTTPEDAIALLDVAIHDFRQFEMDEGSIPLPVLEPGMQLVFSTMLHARGVFSAMRKGEAGIGEPHAAELHPRLDGLAANAAGQEVATA